MVRPVLSFVALSLACAVLLVWRSPDALLDPILYAEDGTWAAFLYWEGAWAGYTSARPDYLVVGNIVLMHLSEDCWLLWADGYGGQTHAIEFTALDRFSFQDTPPRPSEIIPVETWRDDWNARLRPFLLPPSARELYRGIAMDPTTRRLEDVANVGIGYVSGANEFFHLRPSEAKRRKIPKRFLHPAVRGARSLPPTAVDEDTLARWTEEDAPFLLLRIKKGQALPCSVDRYLGSRGSFCRIVR